MKVPTPQFETKCSNFTEELFLHLAISWGKPGCFASLLTFFALNLLQTLQGCAPMPLPVPHLFNSLLSHFRGRASYSTVLIMDRSLWGSMLSCPMGFLCGSIVPFFLTLRWYKSKLVWNVCNIWQRNDNSFLCVPSCSFVPSYHLQCTGYHLTTTCMVYLHGALCWSMSGEASVAIHIKISSGTAPAWFGMECNCSICKFCFLVAHLVRQVSFHKTTMEYTFRI